MDHRSREEMWGGTKSSQWDPGESVGENRPCGEGGTLKMMKVVIWEGRKASSRCRDFLRKGVGLCGYHTMPGSWGGAVPPTWVRRGRISHCGPMGVGGWRVSQHGSLAQREGVCELMR